MPADILTASILIPSYRRPAALTAVLLSLAGQVAPPDEVLVVWQGDDTPTRDAAERLHDRLPASLVTLSESLLGPDRPQQLALDDARPQFAGRDRAGRGSA